MKQKSVALVGDQAVAHAVRQSNVDLIAAYPITPQTIIVETLNEFLSNGELSARYINVESEHSALSAVIGGSLAGGRTFTATASQGLGLMQEVLYVASGLRCPIIMAVTTRAMSAPINIHADHSDVMGSRDAGWMQIFCENVQEAYDLTLMAFRLAERDDVLLPIMVNLDGFLISHTMEDLKILEDSVVSEYLPPRVASLKLDPERPMTFGSFALPDYYTEFKRQQVEGIENALRAAPEEWKRFEALSGRKYTVTRPHFMDGAEIALVSMGTSAGTARYAASKMREDGLKVGALSVRLFRPFPSEEVKKALVNVNVIVVMDRTVSFGAYGGPLFNEITPLLYGTNDSPTIANFIYGLGGRDVTWRMMVDATEIALKKKKTGEKIPKAQFLGVRE
ncbi:MAG: pyruvate ferredoxin oxidoreductase [Nitrososphaerales archaeon]|nr:pyruvate ferredoxin oxidoreductase [Nitrososphaerales archaeon]